MKKNSLLTGIIIGVIAPVLAHFVTNKTAAISYFQGKALSIYVLAALINLLYARYCYRNQQDKTGMGVILITFVGLLYLMIIQKIRL